MTSIPKNLALGQLTTTALKTIYTAPADFNTGASVLTFTNTTSTPISIDVYHGNGTDFLQSTLTLAGGSGREKIYYGFQQRIINASQTVKVQADQSTAFNFSMSGSEVAV